MNDDSHSRFYWRFIREFPEVYDDDRLYANWMRLLVIADQAYPGDGIMPKRASSTAVKKLVGYGLVELTLTDRYRIKGLDADRERRSAQGRAGGLASGLSRASNERSMDVTPTGKVVLLIKHLTGMDVRGSATSATLHEDVQAVGVERVMDAIKATKEAANGEAMDPAGLIFGAHNRLFPLPDRPAKEDTRARDEAKAFDLRVAATKRRLATYMPQEEP